MSDPEFEDLSPLPSPRYNSRLRFGPGAADAAVRLCLAAVLTGLLIYAFVERWYPLLCVAIGAVWALVVGGLIIAPLVSSGVADALGQMNRRQAPATPQPSPAEKDAWGERRRLPPPVDGFGPQAAAAGAAARRAGSSGASGFDWEGLISDVARQLTAAMGEAFEAEASASSLVLRHGAEVRQVSLGAALQPPPLDVPPRIQRGCLKMMDEAQMFAMRILHEPWPAREAADEVATGDLPRPKVRLESGQILMSWGDSWGVVLQLPPISFGARQGPKPDSDPSGWS